ncbi:Uncharacterised protein [Bordetella pertussis]|nr:Uncharacterised protein [Bordetella pertussis]
MRVLRGLGHSGSFPCISSRTIPGVSQQFTALCRPINV